MMRALFFSLLLLFGLPLHGFADTALAPTELQRTWQQAVVYVPDEHGNPQKITTKSLPGYLQTHPKERVILYAHGCSGIIRIGRAAGKFYASNGYIFVAPDSFARKIKPISCRPLLHQGGLHRKVLGWRQAEIDHALTRLRALPGLGNAPIALVGHSEGGITAATFRGAPVSARIIEGWTCHAGWQEYKGLNAPKQEPVLSLVGKNDPWFQLPELRGDCGPYMDGNDQSIVLSKPDPLHNNHWLSKNQRVRRAILEFLLRHL